MSLSKNLQFIRAQNQMTQEQLAEELNVTRQSVSKWESGASFPEMDTLLLICERYHVNLDELMRGSVEEKNLEETKGFIRHMKTYSIQMTAAVSMIIAGVGVVSLLDGHAPEYLCGALFMAVVAAAVVIMVASGCEHARYVKKHPKLKPVYEEGEIERFDRSHTWMIAGGVGLILFGFLLCILMDGAGYEDVSGGVLLLLVAAAVGCFVFAGIRRSLYHVEEYNKENAAPREWEKNGKKAGAVCGAIMLAATAIFLVWGFWGVGTWNGRDGHFGSSWIVFPVGGLLCGIVSTLMGIFHKD